MNKSANSSQPQTQEGNFEFILNYLKRLDEYEQDGKLYPDYDDGRGGSGVAKQPPQQNKQDVKVIKFAQNYSRTKKTRRNAKYDTKNECRNEFQIRRTIGFFAWQSFYDVIDNKLSRH